MPSPSFWATSTRCRLAEGEDAMDFETSPKVRALQGRLEAFMDEHVYPAEARHFEEAMDAWPLGGLAGDRGAEAPRARGGAVEPVPAGERARCGADQPGIRAALRDHGAIVPGARGLQLQRARHGQHGGAGPLWHARAAGALAEAPAGGRDPLGLRHDRAGGRLVGRDQHREPDQARRRPGRRRVRRQRPQMVHDERDASELRRLHLHGQVGPGEPGPAQAAVDDPGAAGCARRAGAAADPGLQLLRHAGPGLGGGLRRCPRAGGEHAAGRGPRVRDRARPARAGAHPPLHAADRPGRALPRD